MPDRVLKHAQQRRIVVVFVLFAVFSSLVVGGIGAVAYYLANERAAEAARDAEVAEEKARLSQQYDYRACLDRNEVKSVLELTVTTLGNSRNLDYVTRQVFIAQLPLLKASDCLAILRAAK